jgi:hypothetical protein
MIKYSISDTLTLAAHINMSGCLKDLNNFILNEGCADAMPVFVGNEVVIDTDCIERKIARKERRNRNKSMDSSFVIIDDINSSKEIMLVESRFNYQNMKNLNQQELFDKVIGTIQALNYPSNIHNKYIYIFNSNLKQQAIRRFRNMVPSMPNNYIATDIRDLKATYF